MMASHPELSSLAIFGNALATSGRVPPTRVHFTNSRSMYKQTSFMPASDKAQPPAEIAPRTVAPGAGISVAPNGSFALACEALISPGRPHDIDTVIEQQTH